MTHHPYLIVGGGMAAHAAARAIREVDHQAPIGIISAERHPPYARPPLSKKLWTGEPEESVWLELPPGVDLLLDRWVLDIDRQARQVFDDRAEAHTYDKLLLAAGGAPRQLPWKDPRIVHFRTLDDYRQVRRAVSDGARRVAVVGGGFIGSEVAASLTVNGVAVTSIFPGPHLCARTFPPDLAEFVTGYYRDRGVTVCASDRLVELTPGPSGLVLRTEQGRRLIVDLVVAGLGIAPGSELASAGGLAVGNGIEVDAALRTSDPHIWAAGDAASFYSPAMGRRLRVEHEDNAVAMGRAAGLSMAGEVAAYTHLPFFYSDLFDLGYEAVGELDASLDVVEDWRQPHREGVVYYLAGGRVRGVLLWNVWGQVEAARALIRDERGSPDHPVLPTLDAGQASHP